MDKAKLLAQLEDAEKYDCVSPDRTKAFAAFIGGLLQTPEEDKQVLSRSETDYLLALAYQNGLFVEFDYPYAAQKFKAAANAKHADAAHALANMYHHGAGIPRDLEKAASWYKKETLIAEEHYQKAVEQLKKVKSKQLFAIDFSTGKVEKNDEEIDTLNGIINHVIHTLDDLVVRCCNNARTIRDEGYWAKAERLYRIALNALELINGTANQLKLKEKYHDRIQNEMQTMLMFSKKPNLNAFKSAWEESLKQYEKSPHNPKYIHSLLHSGHNYGALLLNQCCGEESRRVMTRALQGADEAVVAKDRPIYELKLTLLRDIGRSYLAEKAKDESTRHSNSDKALELLGSVIEQLDNAPFDLEENPYLYTLKPMCLLNMGIAYEYVDDFATAFEYYQKSLKGILKASEDLGDRAETVDYPFIFLQLFSGCIEQLSQYRIEELDEPMGQIVEMLLLKYGKREYTPDQKEKAELYLESLRSAYVAYGGDPSML